MKWKYFRFNFLFVESTVFWAAVNIVDFTIYLWIKPVAAFCYFVAELIFGLLGGRQRTPNLTNDATSKRLKEDSDSNTQ